jgi:hypothetical protein
LDNLKVLTGMDRKAIMDNKYTYYAVDNVLKVTMG